MREAPSDAIFPRIRIYIPCGEEKKKQKKDHLRRVPRRGPAWPMMFNKAMAAPRFESLPWLLIVQGRIFAMHENTPAAARNTAKYRTPTPLHVARTMYPAPPISESTTSIAPRCWVLSAIQVVVTQTMKASTSTKPGSLIAILSVIRRVSKPLEVSKT